MRADDASSEGACVGEKVRREKEIPRRAFAVDCSRECSLVPSHRIKKRKEGNSERERERESVCLYFHQPPLDDTL